MTQTLFFLTKLDLVALFCAVEERESLLYVRAGSIGSEQTDQIGRFSSGLTIPTLGEATADSSMGSESFLVLPREVDVVLRRVGDYVLIDQLVNPDSIVLTPGGLRSKTALMSGRVGTVHKADAASRLMAAFRSTLRQQCTKVDVFYVGREAEQLWRSGFRLTDDLQSPHEYDLMTAGM